MVKYECPKCFKYFDRKSSYNYHMNKKYPCIKNEIIIDKIDSIDNISKNRNITKIRDISKILEIQKENMQNNINNNKFQCVDCLKCYSTNYNLNKHIKICSVKKNTDVKIINNDINDNFENNNDELIKIMKVIMEQNNILVKKLEIQEKQNDELKKQIKQKKNKSKINININNSNNYGNIVNVYEHGKENLNQISNNIILDAIRKGQGVSHITNIIESIYLNPDLPQYQNIYISDINRQKCMVHNGFKWILSDINKIYELISRVISFSKDKHEEFLELYQNNKSIQDKLKIFKKYLNYCDPEYLEELKNEQEEFDDNLINYTEIKRCKELVEILENNVIKLFYNKKDIILEKK